MDVTSGELARTGDGDELCGSEVARRFALLIEGDRDWDTELRSVFPSPLEALSTWFSLLWLVSLSEEFGVGVAIFCFRDDGGPRDHAPDFGGPRDHADEDGRRLTADDGTGAATTVATSAVEDGVGD